MGEPEKTYLPSCQQIVEERFARDLLKAMREWHEEGREAKR